MQGGTGSGYRKIEKVIGIKSLLSYEGDSVKELEQDFQNVIDEYLQDCKEQNKIF